MKDRKYAAFGFAGPILALLAIAASTLLSPWFSWQHNALSDLGHATKSPMAPLFNSGLLLTGFFITIYAITVFRADAKYTSYCLLFSALALQSVATFDEVYGFIHFVASVLFFTSLGVASIVYGLEKKSIFASITTLIFIVAWATYGMGVYGGGIAIPEIVSSVAAGTWISWSAFKIYIQINEV